MRTALILLFTVCFVSQVLAQSNFKEGYIITNNNDTVYGWIDFKLDELNMQFVNFKSLQDSTTQHYLPDDIYGYRLVNEGKFYISKTIEIKEGEKQLVFLEFLVQGLKNLYYFKDDMEYYFIENTDGELIVMSKLPDSVQDYKVKVDLKYRGVLKYVFRDYELIGRKTEKADFNKRSMIELTKDYHNYVCEDGTACIIFENDFKKKFIELDLSVFGGMQFYRLKYYPSLDYLQETRYAGAMIPEIGLQLSICSPRFSTSLAMFGELSYSSVDGADDFFITDNHNTTYSIYAYSANRFSGTFGLKYIFLSENKLRPVIEAGYFTSYLTNPACEKNVYVTRNSTNITRHVYFPNYLLKTELCGGYAFSFGLDYQLNNKKYVFGKIGYSATVTKRDLYNYEPRAEDAFQLKFGYIF
jgi:hypothetical protein